MSNWEPGEEGVKKKFHRAKQIGKFRIVDRVDQRRMGHKRKVIKWEPKKKKKKKKKIED
jgi:hypothetical protein